MCLAVERHHLINNFSINQFILRKLADRLGKLVFANKVSIGGVGGGRCPVGQTYRNKVVLRFPFGIF